MDACFSAHDMQKYQYLPFLSFKWLWLRWCLLSVSDRFHLFAILFLFLPTHLALYSFSAHCHRRRRFIFHLHAVVDEMVCRYNWKDQTVAYTTDAIFILIFVFGLIFHAHQTEATYRLDFIWKLQATGKIEHEFLAVGCVHVYTHIHWPFIISIAFIWGGSEWGVH